MQQIEQQGALCSRWSIQGALCSIGWVYRVHYVAEKEQTGFTMQQIEQQGALCSRWSIQGALCNIPSKQVALCNILSKQAALCNILRNRLRQLLMLMHKWGGPTISKEKIAGDFDTSVGVPLYVQRRQLVMLMHPQGVPLYVQRRQLLMLIHQWGIPLYV